MDIKELDDYNLRDAVELHDELNPRLFSGDHLRPEVREALLKIADDFREYLGVSDLRIRDITFSGSNAAYAYTPHSDIDLHLVVDFPEDDEIYRELFDAKKYQYNETHDITVRGYDVELYVQDAKQAHHSAGVYSIKNDDWEKMPRRQRVTIQDRNVQDKYETLKCQIECVLDADDYDKIINLQKKIKNMRSTGLEKSGEFGPENLAFKMLRTQGYIKRLIDARNRLKSQELSIDEQLKERFVWGFSEGASGYIPKNKQEAQDPRWSHAMTQDIGPGQVKKEAGKMGFKTNSAGVPPRARTNGLLKENRDKFDDLVKFVAKEIGLKQIPAIEYTDDKSRVQQHRTFGTTTNDGQDRTIWVYVGDRNTADAMRTLTHELVHARQFEKGQASLDMDPETEQRIEDHANAFAGRIMRKYGKIDKEIYETNPVQPAARTQDRPARPEWIKKKTTNKDNDFASVLAQQLERFKQKGTLKESQELTEVSMSPGALKAWAKSPEARRVRVGFEFEMYFPNTSSDPDDLDDEPYDYDYDRQAHGIADVIDFFGEGNNASPRGVLNRLEAQMYDQYNDWRQEMIDEEMTESGFFEFMDESDETEEIRMDKQSEFRLEAEEELGDEAGRDEISDRAQELWVNWVDTQWNRGDSVYMEQYRDHVADSLEENFGEEAWLQSEYRYMSDVANEWNLDWPYMNEYYREVGGTDPETWADQLSSVIGMPVKTGGYHSTRRGEDHANLEYDSSLSDPDDSDDAGLELITPYRPLPEALQILDRVIEFADQNGIYTNESTGLHMNVSLEGVKNVDWVKLVMFLGDTYILDTFERRANTYARSSMDKLMKKIRERRAETIQEQDEDRAIYAGEIDINRAMQLMRDNMIELARQAVQSGLGRDKYQSVHVKELGNGGSYIEFRGPGGDWLGKQDENADVLRNTVFRLGRAMEIAADPKAERQEYAKKLYKALTPEMPELRSAMQLFAQYNAGDINREQLKREWAEAVLQAERDKISQQRTTGGSYKIVDRNNGEVLDRYEAGSDSEALEYAMNHWAGKGINYDIKREVKDTDPTPKEKRRRELARRVAEKPIWWRVSVKDRPKYTGWIKAPTAARAIQDYERRMNIEGDFKRTSFDTRVEEPPALRDEPMPDAVKDLSVRPESWFPRRSNWALVTADGEVDETFVAPDREAAMDRLRSWQNEPNKPDTPRWVVPIEREAPAQPQPTTATNINQPGEGESHWQVTWDEYRERDGERIRFTDALRVAAASAAEASRRLTNSLTAQGRNPFNITATPTNPPPWSQNRAPAGEPIPGSTLDIQRQRQQAAQQRPLEFTGRWLVRSTRTGETVHTISGIGNVQDDANRHAERWVRATGFDDGVEVVPEMG